MCILPQLGGILYNSSGDVSPVSYHHGPRKMLREPEEFCIVESLLANPGTIYLEELQPEFFQSTSSWASIRTICQLNFTRNRLRHVAMQQSDVKRAEFTEEMNYISANMIVWLDETGSDRQNERRKFGYLRGMTPTDYELTVSGNCLSSTSIMSTRGLDVDTYEGNINGDIFCDY